MTSEQRLPRIVPPAGLRFHQPIDGNMPWALAPLEDPTWLPASEAAHMHDEDVVLVVAPASTMYVLPWWVMKNHHVANLELDGAPITVTLCERCSSASAFDAQVDGERRTFQVVGMWKGTHVVADHETESIWTSFSGECIWGFHRGRRLEHLPLLQTSWRECRTLAPELRVVDGAGESREGHGSNRWPGSLEEPMGGYDKLDPRLPQNELVLGVEAGGVARAYPLAKLQASGGVVNDTLGGVEIVALGGQTAYTAIAFARRLGDRVLTLVRDDGRTTDQETGSVWDLSGFSVSGPLEGERLAFVPSGVEEWYAWAAYHPETEIA